MQSVKNEDLLHVLGERERGIKEEDRLKLDYEGQALSCGL